MANAPILVAESDTLRDVVADVIREEMVDSVPDAIKEVEKGKWENGKDVKKEFGVTNRQLQYLRNENEITYTQRGRQIWYLRESLEEYFEGGRVDADQSE